MPRQPSRVRSFSRVKTTRGGALFFPNVRKCILKYYIISSCRLTASCNHYRMAILFKMEFIIFQTARQLATRISLPSHYTRYECNSIVFSSPLFFFHNTYSCDRFTGREIDFPCECQPLSYTVCLTFRMTSFPDAFDVDFNGIIKTTKL